MKNSSSFFTRRFVLLGRGGMLFLLWFLPHLLFAQKDNILSTLFSAWEENNPDAQVFFLQKEAIKQRKKMIFTLSGFSIEGQYGQINSDYAQDYQLNFRVEPLQLFGLGKRRAALQAEGEALTAEQAHTRLWGQYQIKKAYLEGCYAKAEIALYEAQLIQASRYLEAARAQTESGASSALALQRAQTLRLQLQLQRQQAEQRRQSAQTALVQLTGVSLEKIKFKLPKELQKNTRTENDSLPPALRLAQAQAQQRRAAASATEAEALPQIGFSGFTQQIDGLGGLFGAGLVLHLPWGNGTKRRATLQKIEAESLQKKANSLVLQYENTKQAMQVQYQQAEQNLQLADSAVAQAQATRQLLRQQLDLGAINFLEFYLAQESAFLAEREALSAQYAAAMLRLDVELLNGKIHENAF